MVGLEIRHVAAAMHGEVQVEVAAREQQHLIDARGATLLLHDRNPAQTEDLPVPLGGALRVPDREVDVVDGMGPVAQATLSWFKLSPSDSPAHRVAFDARDGCALRISEPASQSSKVVLGSLAP